MSEVVLENLTRRYDRGGGAAALERLTLRVAPGELLVVVGPSGCGKSTSLRLIAGLDEPDEGSIRIGGREMRGVAPQDRDVAMVFQGYALYPHMRVREILEFPLKMRGEAPDARKRKVGHAADLLGLGRLLERRPGELSGGERQRVAMGRAIVREPKVFLFDEPLANLDAALRATLRTELGALVERLGTTSLYVTHDHVEAMTLGDRIAVLRAGRLEQLGTPREIYERPRTEFVATFLGSPPMSLLDVEHGDGGASLGGAFELAEGDAPASAARAGVRPEHVRVAASAEGGGARALRATLEVGAVEPLGAETHVELVAPRVRLRARVAGFDAPARGERVPVAIDAARVAWFDASGERVEGAR